MASSPVLLILGSGSNVGQSVARAFAAKGYKIALASRSSKNAENTSGRIHIVADFSDPASLPAVFEKVKALLGVPSVVIYNAAAATGNEAKHPFSLPLAAFTKDLNINTVAPFVAAQQAVQGFEQLPASASRTFIYTGNALNTTIIPSLVTLGVGKSASAHFLEIAATAYKERGYKFYFADERRENGAPVGGEINGEAHAKLYAELAENEGQGPWQQTFVKGIGYKDFTSS